MDTASKWGQAYSRISEQKLATALPTMRKAFIGSKMCWNWSSGTLKRSEASSHPEDKCHLWFLLDFFQERLRDRFLVMGSFEVWFSDDSNGQEVAEFHLSDAGLPFEWTKWTIKSL